MPIEAPDLPGPGESSFSGQEQAAQLLASTSVEQSEDQFDALAPEQQDHEVSRALTLIEAAETSDIKLSAQDIAMILGYEEPSRVRGLMEKVREKTPGLHSRRERFSAAIDDIQEKAQWGNQERDQQAAAGQWFADLSPDQASSIHLHINGAGPEALQSLGLSTGGEPPQTFEVSRMMTLPEDIKQALSPEEQQFLESRQQFWHSLKVETGPAAERFLEDHFERVKIDLNGEVPPEMEWLLSEQGGIKEIIQQLQASGAEVTLLKCRETPDSVLDAIRHVAVKSQHKFVTTWLPQLLGKDAQPKVLESDRESVREGYRRLQTATDKLVPDGSFRHALVTELFSQKETEDLDFDRSIQLIQAFGHNVLALQASGEPTLEQAGQIEEINDVLANGLGREYARRRLTADDAARSSEGARAIIKTLAVLGPTVEVMENYLHIGGIAKMLAASGDDVLSEAAELSALKGAGMNREELMKRVKILAPAAILAMGTASLVDKVGKTVNQRVAGTMFSSAAVMLSAATGVLSVKYFADQYRMVAEEGKLPDRVAIDPAVAERLGQLETESISTDELVATIEEALEAAGSTGLEHEEVMQQIREMAQAQPVQQIVEACQSPSARERYRAGLKEAMGVNPARLGLTVGTYSAPAMGALLGPVFLRNPMLYALAGSYETICGAASMWIYDKTFDLRWNRFIKGRQEVASSINQSAASETATGQA
jgi:hypothetical protein